ncbi:unnamed protein product [Dimorphilus gyrociliatus]|uniref:Uncharacterized protein n=1 Tax=Dimorphilus gyrociliatus TaxID=2664684 RepID=A0A7I8V5R1_9ANNE|nr:unnamed protein product [Dimorphilus gyrociliatus]
MIEAGTVIKTKNTIKSVHVSFINTTIENTQNFLDFANYNHLSLNISSTVIKKAMALLNVIRVFNNDFSQAFISITNSIFENSTSSLGGIIHIQNKEKGRFILLLEECIFRRNKAVVAGSVVQIDSLNLSDKSIIRVKSTTFINNTNQESAAAIYVYGAQIEIDQTKFLNNHVRLNSKGLIHRGSFPTPTQRQGAGGAIYAHITSRVKITNCIFINNTATWFGGSIAGEGELTIKDSEFENGDSFEHATSGDILFLSGNCILSNITFRVKSTANNLAIIWYSSPGDSYLTGEQDIKVSCPVGSKLRTDTLPEIFISETLSIVYKDFLLFCDPCPDQTYSLDGGTLFGSLSSKNLTITPTDCISCPYGGSCSRGKVGANENFWGFKKKNKNEIKFINCQDSYCCTKKRCDSYNECAPNRVGPLCGECRADMSEVLFSPDCRENEKCTDSWFIIIEIISIFISFLFFAYQMEITLFIMQRLLWVPITHSDDAAMAGYIKSIFYFYQTVPLVVVWRNRAESVISTHIQPVIVTIMSFAPIAAFVRVCPFLGLTSIGKLIYTNSKLTLSLVALLLFVLLRYIFVKLRVLWKKRRRRTQELAENDLLLEENHNPDLCPEPSFKIRMIIAALNIIIYNYVNVSTLIFSLLSCTNVGQENAVLYFDGNVNCGEWWQYFVGIMAFAYVIPFFLQVIISRMLLDRDVITPKQFMLSYLFPLPMLIYFGIKHASFKEFKHILQRTNSHISITARDRPDLLEELDETERLRALCLFVVEEPFLKKGYEDLDKSHKYWEGVLVFRRLVVILMRAFIQDPLSCTTCQTLASLAFLLWHLHFRPFAAKSAQNLETAGLSGLLIIGIMHMVEATFIASGVQPSGPNNTRVLIFDTIELIIIAALPLLLGVGLVFSMLAKLLLSIYNKIKAGHGN